MTFFEETRGARARYCHRFARRQSYGGYLCLDRLLAAQQPVSGTGGKVPRHDEMLFIVQHQVSAAFLRRALDRAFFPELLDVRSVIGAR